MFWRRVRDLVTGRTRDHWWREQAHVALIKQRLHDMAETRIEALEQEELPDQPARVVIPVRAQASEYAQRVACLEQEVAQLREAF